jgi:endo-1,4-beta-D-glucanase Y
MAKRSMMKTRLFLFIGFLLFSSGGVRGEERESWEAFKSRFLSPDGRVVDFYQGQISHSEGQGYGMLLAALFDDSAAFRKLRLWTRDNLQVRKSDALHAWKWGLRPNGQWAVIDLNNATDGDLLIAMALLEGAKKWKEESYRQEALAVIRAIREHLIIRRKETFLLLPGYYGFTRSMEEILNPSYWVFPAFRYFAAIEDSAFWLKIHADSLDLLRRANFGPLSLPPDWLRVNDTGLFVHEAKSRYFGYEAVRILLYLSWDGNWDALPGARKLLDLARRVGYIPATIDLVDHSIALNEASGGIWRVYARLAKEMGEKGLEQQWAQMARKKLSVEKDDYYSHVLYLLSPKAPKP